MNALLKVLAMFVMNKNQYLLPKKEKKNKKKKNEKKMDV